MPGKEAEACERARQLVASMSGALVRVGSDQTAASEIADEYVASWNELRYVGVILGARSPFREVPTVWDWWAKVIAELDAPASRSEWIASRTAAFVAVVKSVEDRLAGKDDATFDARYYRDARGAMPVLAYIKQQQTPVSASIRRRIEFLNKLTVDRPFLAYPHGDALQGRYGDGFFELRIKAGVHHRILYRPYGRTAVLLHVFPKKGDDVPESDKLIAYNRWTDLTDRLDTLPDPIGDAAP